MKSELTEEDEDKQEASNSEEGLNSLRAFSKFLVKALKSLPDIQEKIIKEHLGCNKKNRKTLVFAVPCFQTSQAAYAWNKYLEKNSEIKLITRFSNSSTEYSPATYEQIEIKRGKRISLCMHGWIFFTYKEVNFVAYFYWEGMHPNADLYFNKNNEKEAIALIDEIRIFMKDFNFLKGEKLKVSSGRYFSFLEYPKLGWRNVILPTEIKDEILLNIIFPLANKKLCKRHQIPWRRGVLLGGEPGTGKTLISKVLCNLLDKVTVLWVTSESIDDANDVRVLFKAARFFAPTLMIMEDIDFFGRDRAIERSPVIGELLNQLDGNSPNEGVFILASSNRPGLLDKALANRPGRLDVKIEVKLPNLENRLKMIKLFSKGKKLVPNIDLQSIANQTEDFTGAHLKEVLVYAALHTIKNKEAYIKQESLNKAIKRLRGKNHRVGVV